MSSPDPPAPPTKPVARGLSLLAVVLGGALITALIASLDETYENVQAGNGVAAFDRPVLDWMVAHRTPALDSVVTAFTNLGSATWMPVIATIVTVLLAWRWRRWTPVVLMVVATLGSLVMTRAGKVLTARARPPQVDAVPPYETTPSFPSGHTLNATVIALVLAYLVLLYVPSRAGRVTTALGLVAFALAMGTSRVFLGHHWLTDVLAGWAAGAAWAGVVVLGHRLLLLLLGRRERHERHEEAAGQAAGHSGVAPTD